MPLLEQKSDKIFQVNADLSQFIYDDKEVNVELQNYVNTLKQQLNRDNLATFLFDNKFQNGKKVIDVYQEKNPDLSKEDKAILKGLNSSIKSVFEIKRVLKEGFELYNLANEKTYTVKNMIKMVNYRGVVAGNYFICRIIPYENEYNLLVLNTVFKTADTQQAYKAALSMQVENPELLYRDNDEKLKELEEIVEKLKLKFNEFFKSDEVITTNNHIDALLSAFNDFAESEDADKEIADIQEFINKPEKYSYFEIEEQGDPFDFATQRGNKNEYDVGIIFDPELGIQVLPFYATFKQLFEADDYKQIQGYKECIRDYFTNGKVPPFVIKKVYDAYGDKFLNIAKEVLELEEITNIDALLVQYKQEFYTMKKFSSTTVLYSSEAFSKLMDISMEMQESGVKAQSIKNTGRNEPCPCGSGKKYKKCCLN